MSDYPRTAPRNSGRVVEREPIMQFNSDSLLGEGRFWEVTLGDFLHPGP